MAALLSKAVGWGLCLVGKKGKADDGGGDQDLLSPFQLDLVNEQLWRESQVILLRPKTFAVLRYLVEHAERLVTKDEPLRAVWGDTHVSEEGLRDYLREIR